MPESIEARTRQWEIRNFSPEQWVSYSCTPGSGKFQLFSRQWAASSSVGLVTLLLIDWAGESSSMTWGSTVLLRCSYRCSETTAVCAFGFRELCVDIIRYAREGVLLVLGTSKLSLEVSNSWSRAINDFSCPFLHPLLSGCPACQRT